MRMYPLHLTSICSHQPKGLTLADSPPSPPTASGGLTQIPTVAAAAARIPINLRRAPSFTQQLHKNLPDIPHSRAGAMLSHYCVSGGLLWPSVSPPDRNGRLMGARSGIIRHWQAGGSDPPGASRSPLHQPHGSFCTAPVSVNQFRSGLCRMRRQ